MQDNNIGAQAARIAGVAAIVPNFEYKIKNIPTTYKGVRFRSRLEATWAAFFDKMGWNWEYEPIDLDGWTPDFVISGELGMNIFVEVKPIFDLTQLNNLGKYEREIIKDDIYVGNCIIVGLSPTIEKNHSDSYGGKEDVLRIGWCNSLGGWQNAILKPNNDLGTTKWFIYQLINGGYYWKDFADREEMELVLTHWNQAKNEVQFLK